MVAGDFISAPADAMESVMTFGEDHRNTANTHKIGLKFLGVNAGARWFIRLQI